MELMIVEPITKTSILSIRDSLWFTIVTMATVGKVIFLILGYGDLLPSNTFSKIFTSIMIFSGLLFIALPTAILN